MNFHTSRSHENGQTRGYAESWDSSCDVLHSRSVQDAPVTEPEHAVVFNIGITSTILECETEQADRRHVDAAKGWCELHAFQKPALELAKALMAQVTEKSK